MTWSLFLRNGDFDVQGAQLGKVTGQAKLVQDFRCAVLTEMGSDPMHPGWGSLIDGGVTPDGRAVPGVIGATDTQLALAVIETEIRRIAEYFQNRQLRRIKEERQRYSKSTLTASEILVGVSGVRAIQTSTTLAVLVTLATGSGDTVDVALPISDNSLVAR
ncbi:hypothetical protein [Candidatus Solirubrobacter pratensis]|uniref:hypothetical protein n=1 Tax=Candidatus Solirubrobacter pratensis TaxID=1298857 RepID=UPI000486CE74|nr:hypothetical protein [Candidatus Solirubrobacter pratensis]